MKLPIINQALNLVIKGKTHHVTCTDLFDGGYGFYFDALFPKTTLRKFSEGEQCLADLASYPKKDRQTVRFLILKWSS